MRILLTTDTIGGVWTFTKELTTELLSRGHEVALISFGQAPSSAQAGWSTALMAQYPGSFSYEASTAPLEWMDSNQSTYAEALPAILKLVDKFSPDVIHSNQFCFGDLPRNIPVVVTAHSDVLGWAEACEPDALKPSAWLSQYKSLVESGLAEASAVTAPTTWMLHALRANFSFTAPAYIVLNGRNIPAQTATEPRQLRAVSVGRLWDKAKNLSMLADTVSPIPIVVAGETTHERTSTYLPNHSLQLLGPLNETELIDLFSTSSIYIVPSLYEPFGLAPLEAALCGCAVLAHDIPSLREVWGESALYFQDAEELSPLLNRLYQDHEALSDAQRHSQDRARQLTASDMTDHYLDIYNSLSSPHGLPQTEFDLHAV